ncbi:hypothetical protein SDC9_162498 [bioreactor metagenome]|uniref:Uncharacterized protein n=1 Tax=bioreactor metagenome TaxID=1076179 RepID=A0A645FP89_9ZZZZ
MKRRRRVLVHRPDPGIAAVLGNRRRIVDGLNRDAHRRRRAQLSVGNRVLKGIRAGIVRIRHIENIASVDGCRAVAGVGDARNRQRVPLRVGIVAQHRKCGARILVDGISVVNRMRRVVLRRDIQRSRCARFCAREIHHRIGKRHRAGEISVRAD